MSDTRANFRQVKFIPKRIHIVEINSARWNGWDGNSFRFYCRTIGRHTWPDRIKSRKAHTWTNPNGRWWIYLFLKRRMVRSTINFVCIIYEILVCITIHLCMHYLWDSCMHYYSFVYALFLGNHIALLLKDYSKTKTIIWREQIPELR
jgi:hypothetical protein